MRFPPLIGLAAMVISLTTAIGAAAAQPARRVGHDASQIGVSGPPIIIETSKGTLIRLKQPASTVFIANPDIADVQVKSPTLLYLSGKTPGETVIYAVDANDDVLMNSPIRVIHDLSRLRQSIAELVPGQHISVESVQGNLVMSGMVASAGDAHKVRSLVQSIAGGKGANIIDHLKIATPNEVSLHVRIAEVDRKVLKSLGINWFKSANNANATLRFSTQNGVAAANPSSIIFGRSSGLGQAISAEIDALAQDGYVTTLAEPNLTAMSGQTASFLAGGEYPVPAASNAGTAGTTVLTVTIEFKQYGVGLAFTPTVIDANHLNLRVRPEVSTLDYSNAVTENGFVIPALTVRRADTTVELASGQSFALAGLLQNSTNQDYTKVPWLGDIPILGALFRSSDFQRGETELVIIVTPYLVKPVATRLAAPTDGFTPSHDVQRVLGGELYRQTLPGPSRGPLDAGGKGLVGPAGFQLN